MIGLAALAPDLIASLGGLIVPPAFDFIKKKFLKKGEDTIESTAGSLAMTHPEQLGPFIKGQVKLLKARTEYFNRDVIGEVSQWVVNLRASIRPITVAVGLVAILAHCSDTWILKGFEMDVGIRVFFETNISSWFGNRLTTGGK